MSLNEVMVTLVNQAAAVTAVLARATEKIALIGDQIVQICEGCHKEFKLSFPTAGKFGELSPTPSQTED